MGASAKGGRTVLVTGAAAGIGWSVAHAFAAAGDVVFLADRDADAARLRAKELGGSHRALAMDMADERAVTNGVAEAVAHTGRLDVLVNNAGVVDAQAIPILDKAMEDVRAITAVNLRGSYLAAREAGRAMLAAGSGSIVNVASLSALIAIPGRAAYVASKAGLLGLTRALACEWAPHGVRVNAVLPGYVETDIVRALVEAGRVDLGAVAARIPLGRLARPDEIAAAVVWLAGAGYAAGAEFVVDGGYAAFGGSGPASQSVAPPVPVVEQPVVLVTGGARAWAPRRPTASPRTVRAWPCSTARPPRAGPPTPTA